MLNDIDMICDENMIFNFFVLKNLFGYFEWFSKILMLEIKFKWDINFKFCIFLNIV